MQAGRPSSLTLGPPGRFDALHYFSRHRGDARRLHRLGCRVRPGDDPAAGRVTAARRGAARRVHRDRRRSRRVSGEQPTATTQTRRGLAQPPIQLPRRGRRQPLARHFWHGLERASAPQGYATTPAGAPDCDDANPAVFTILTGFADGDNDGVGDGTAQLAVHVREPPGRVRHHRRRLRAGRFHPLGRSRVQLPRRRRRRRRRGGDRHRLQAARRCPPATSPRRPRPPARLQRHRPRRLRRAHGLRRLRPRRRRRRPRAARARAGAPPAGYSTTGTDCADADASVWVPLPYTAVDFDGDGATAPAQGTRCTAGALPRRTTPPRWATTATTPTRAVSISLAVFVDADGDGIGAGPALLRCTNGAPPPGYALTGTDCNDSDAARWTLTAYRGIDADGDGVTVPSPRPVSARTARCRRRTRPPRTAMTATTPIPH